MNSIINNINPKLTKSVEEEKTDQLKYDQNDGSPNKYEDEEEYNLDILNHNMEINIENENNYDNNLNIEQIEENTYNNNVEQNNEYLFEKIKDKLREEKIEDLENNDNDIQENEKIEEEEKISDIYDLPLSINILKNKINSKNNENKIADFENQEINIKKEDKEEEYINYKDINEKNENEINNINNDEDNHNKFLEKYDNINKNNKNKENEIIIKKENNIDINTLDDINSQKNIENNNKKSIEIKTVINSEQNIDLNTNKKNDIPFEIPKGVKFGVDQSGNPINISNLKADSKNEGGKKIIAYIIEQEGEKNYLLDIKGNKLQKTEDDYYLYKEGNEFIIIKDFDIQHPELRVYGHRKINFSTQKTDKNEEEQTINNKINNEIKITLKEKNENKKESVNISPKSESFLENKNLSREKNEKEIHNISVRSYIENIKTKNNHLLNNDLDDILLNSNLKNKSVIIKDNKNDSIKKINNLKNIKTTPMNNFYVQMNIWRQRYGKKIINKEDTNRNYSYNFSPEEKTLLRTDSILKMTSEKNSNVNKIPINKKDYSYIGQKNNYINFIKPNYLFNDHKNFLGVRQNNSFSKNLENPLLKESNKKKEKNNYNYDSNRINIKERNAINLQAFKRNKTLQYINNKYNKINKDFNSFTTRNFDMKNNNFQNRDYLLQNIKQKYKNRKNIEENIFNSINSDNTRINYKENDEIKKHNMNNYIYNNMRKINQNKYIKKNIGIKCSVLSNEASKIIRNFNMKLKQREIEKENIMKKENINFYNQIPIKIINENKKFKKNNYTYINQFQNQNQDLYFDYDNELSSFNENDNNNFILKIPKNIKKNRYEVLNNKFYDSNYIKESNINNYYRRIKHNTSKNSYNNY